MINSFHQSLLNLHLSELKKALASCIAARDESCIVFRGSTLIDLQNRKSS